MPAAAARVALVALLACALIGCRQAGPTAAPSGPLATPSAVTSAAASPAPTAATSGDPVPTDQPTGTAPAASATPPAQATPPASVPPGGALEWSMLDSPFSVFDSVNAAVLGTSGAVAGQMFVVGSTDDGGTAAAWRSADGSVWERLTLPAAAGAELQAIADGPNGLVAVGFSYAGEQPAAAGWQSTDGRSWRQLGGQLGSGEMHAVAGGPAGYVALGADPDEGNRILAWTSTDGIDWSSGAASGIEPDATINGISALDDGFLAYGASAAERAAMWLSGDGLAWQSLDLPGGGNSAVNEVAVGDGRVVAVGAGYEEDFAEAMAWASPDGRSDWQLTLDRDTEGAMFGLTVTPRGYVAVGAVELARFRFDAATWVSDDGTSWRREPEQPGFRQARLYEALAAGATVVALGDVSDEMAEEVQPAVWLGR